MAKGTGQPMTTEDLKEAEERIKGKKSPLSEYDYEMPKGKTKVMDDGREITQIGNFRGSSKFGDSQTLKRFARIEPDFTGWIPMTIAECLLYQKKGLLVGYDADAQKGLLKKPGRIK